MRQGDEIVRHGRLGAFVFSIGTIRNQALIGAICGLAEFGRISYSQCDKRTRGRIISRCEAAIARQEGIEHFDTLSHAYLAAELSACTTLKRIEEKRRVGIVNPRIETYLQNLTNLVSNYNEPEYRDVEHVMRYKAILSAAKLSSDIRTLNPNHFRVSQHAKNGASGFLFERLECASHLGVIAAVLGAASASMLVFKRPDRSLLPFAMYRRVESFTPTRIGVGVAGHLVEIYEGGSNLMSDVSIFKNSERGQIFGAFVSDYNALNYTLKKNAYRERERKYPSVLLALLTGKITGELMAVVYVEAKEGTEFKENDAQFLIEMFEEKHELIKRASEKWDGRGILPHRFGDFVAADLQDAKLNDLDMSQADFSKARMSQTDLTATKLIGVRAINCDLVSSVLRRTVITASDFRGALMDDSDLAGSDVKHCDFTNASLQRANLAGARFKDCKFKNSDLTGTKWRGIDVGSLCFDGAVMRDCVLKELNGVERASWVDVDLEGAKLDHSVWEALPKSVRMLHEGMISVS